MSEMIFTVTQSSQYRRKVCSSARGLVCFTEIEAGIDDSARLSLRASVQEARISGDVCATRHLKDAARHGLWRDKRPEEYEHSIERAWRSHHRLAVRRGTLIGQLAVNERHAATALDKIRPEAERVLSQRQHEAETTRDLLAAIREVTPARQFERERTRGHDRCLTR
jgi:hypothetical protein